MHLAALKKGTKSYQENQYNFVNLSKGQTAYKDCKIKMILQ